VKTEAGLRGALDEAGQRTNSHPTKSAARTTQRNTPRHIDEETEGAQPKIQGQQRNERIGQSKKASVTNFQSLLFS
jgi:hypothetical protein